MSYEIVLSRAADRYHSTSELLDPTATAPLDFTAFVSCYNESAFIVQTLDEVCTALASLPISFEIIVIDDCSTDGSPGLVECYIAEHPDIGIILRKNLVNQGLAQNYIEAAFMGKGRYYKLFCGDNTEPIESIRDICRLIGRADMIIPSYSSVEGKSAVRMLLSQSYTRVVNLVSGNRLHYYNGLAVHLRQNILRWHPNTRGFGFQADIICMLLDRGATYLEIRVPASNRSVSRALTVRNWLSVVYTIMDISIRRMANWVFGR